MVRMVAFTALLALTTPQLLADGANQTNKQLAKSVAVKLKEQAGKIVKDADIEVQVSDGVVWITGDVDCQASCRKVLDVVRRIPGVQQIVNDMRVPKGRQNDAPRVEAPDAISETTTIDIHPSYPIPFTTNYSGRPVQQHVDASPEAVVKKIVNAIKRNQKAKQLKGDVKLRLYDGIAVLTGKVADKQSQNQILRIVGASQEIKYICHQLEIARTDGKIANNVEGKVGELKRLEVPAGAAWQANRQTHWMGLVWEDGAWNLK